SATRATWTRPLVVTSRSPTRVVTDASASVVNVTTTSRGPTLISSAFWGRVPAADTIRRGPDGQGVRRAATDLAGTPTAATAAAPRAPIRGGCRQPPVRHGPSAARGPRRRRQRLLPVWRRGRRRAGGRPRSEWHV